MAIPVWLLGRHVTAISVTPLVDNGNGVLTSQATIPMVSTCDEITVERDVQFEEINALDRIQQHQEIVTWGMSMTIVEILKKTGTNILAGIGAIDNQYGYVYVTFTRGFQTWSGTFTVGRYAEGVRRGKSVGTIQLMPIDDLDATLGANMGYTGTGS